MKDDSKGMPFSTVQATDTVAQRDPVIATNAFDRSLIDSKDHRVALFQSYDLGARLHPRALFGQHKLAAGEIMLGC